MSAPLVIGLCGPARSGKTTLARHFAARGFVVVALGDRLKEDLLTFDPLVSIDLSSTRERSLRPASAIVSDNETVAFTPLSVLIKERGWEGAKRIAHVGSLLQRFGSEAGWMSHGPEHWTKFIDQTIAATNQPVVVSDVRIPHEAEWVTDERPFGHDGVLIGIERARRRDVRDPEHVSERHSSQLSPTVTLLNDGSKAELFAAADDFIERIVESKGL